MYRVNAARLRLASRSLLPFFSKGMATICCTPYLWLPELGSCAPLPRSSGSKSRIGWQVCLAARVIVPHVYFLSHKLGHTRCSKVGMAGM